MRPIIYSVNRKRGSSLEKFVPTYKIMQPHIPEDEKFNFIFVRKVANKNYRSGGRESVHSDSKLK